MGVKQKISHRKSKVFSLLPDCPLYEVAQRERANAAKRVKEMEELFSTVRVHEGNSA